MEEIDKQITIHQNKLKEISKNNINKKEVDKLLSLSRDISNENIILEAFINIKNNIINKKDKNKSKDNFANDEKTFYFYEEFIKKWVLLYYPQ